MKTYQSLASLYLRIALGTSFLSAVADRLGTWGKPGEPNVAWGAWEPFVDYTHTLNFFVPYEVASLLAIFATVLEIVLGVLLLIGLFTRITALGTGVLIAFFALSMTFAIGVKAPLDYSVFTASAAGFVLATLPQYPWSVDEWLVTRKRKAKKSAV